MTDGVGIERALGDDDTAESDNTAERGDERDVPETAGPPPSSRRPSKWDRPPDPRDWRFVVGTFGKVLIAVGVLLFGFVAYQLWGTGIETARAQSSLEDRFEAAVAEADDTATPDITTDTGTDTGTGTGTGTDTDTGTDADNRDDGASSETSDPSEGSSSSDDDAPIEAVDLSDAAVEQDLPDILPGEALARLELPRIDSTTYVVQGVGADDLKKGPGHYPDTPLPGQLGNAAIAGHRTTYGAPFFDVDQLEPGDDIIVTLLNGDRFVYVVTGTQVVGPEDYWVVSTTNPDIAELTLTSCHPKYTARDRIIVHGLLDPERSASVGRPTFSDAGDADDEAADDDATIAGDDPTVTVPAAGTDTTDDATPGTTAAPAVTTTVPVVAGPDDDPPTESDAFTEGWFHDDGAFAQIALWGLALTVISLAAYAVSRRFRHDSIGALVGIVPFVVALYFFFQNVNRLLPPGI